MNHAAWRSAIAGGNWNEGVRNGSRTLNLNDNPWNANGNVGVRGVSDPRIAVIGQVGGIRLAQHPHGSAETSWPARVEHQKMAPSREIAGRRPLELRLMARTHNNLIEQIADWDNLLLAYQKARRGKRQRAEVQIFAADLWLHLGNIQHHLLSGTYRMGAYRSFVTFEPKRREILAAPFGDRVVQHALMNVLEPIWDKCMIEDTYACRKGLGTHVGVDRIQRWLRDMSARRPLHDVWIAKTDFSKYFASIQHVDLKRIIRRKIGCPRTLQVLDTIIDSTPGGVGIPVGNLTSQWMANLLGGELDQWVKRKLKVRRYLRYMDDLVAIFATQAEAEAFVEAIRAMAKPMGLRFSSFSVHRASQGVNALGYRIWPTHRLLRRRSIVAFRRDMRQMIRHDAPADLVSARVLSFVAHAKHADTWRIRSALFQIPARS